MSTRTKAILAIIVASLFWSTAGIVAKALLVDFQPLTISFVRSCIASLLMIPLLMGHKQPPLRAIFCDIVPVALLSVGNFIFYYIGIDKTTVNASAIMYAATPILVAIIAPLTIGEKLSTQKIIGIIIGFVGVVSMFIIPLFSSQNAEFGTVTGNSILLLAVLQWASYTVASRYLSTMKKYEPMTITAVSMFTGVVILGLILPFIHQLPDISLLIRPKVAAQFLYLGIFVSVLTYGLFQWAIKHSSSSTASLTNYLQPIFAFFLTWIFLGERLTPEFLLGTILVFIGVFIVSVNSIKTIAQILRARFF